MFDRCVYFNTNRLSRLVNKIWQESFDSLGLAPAHGYLIRLVLAEPGLSQKEIGKVLYLEKSTIARSIEKMEAQGYLCRRPSDHAGQGVYPTQKAISISQELEQLGDQLYEKMLASFGKDDVTKLVGLLRRASDELQKN